MHVEKSLYAGKSLFIYVYIGKSLHAWKSLYTRSPNILESPYIMGSPKNSTNHAVDRGDKTGSERLPIKVLWTKCCAVLQGLRARLSTLVASRVI